MLIVAVLALLLFLIGCVGIGLAYRLIGGPPGDEAEPALALAGTAALVWLTLVLNAASLFHTAVLIGAILLGAAIFIAFRGRSLLERFGLPDLLLTAVIIVVLAVVAMIFIPPEINSNDDGPAYLLFSEKLARLGASGFEPFSERRLYGFGGQFGIVALIHDLFGPRWLSLYEPGLGLSLIGIWLLIAGRNAPASTLVRVSLVFGLALFWLTLGGKPIANLAPSVLYAAFLFGAVEAWLRVLGRGRDAPNAGGWFLWLAVWCAVALSLRPTAAPFIGLLAVSAAWPMLRDRRWRALGFGTGAALVVLAPAMLASLQASGTPFYPFLGTGVHAPGTYLPSDPGAVIGQNLRQIWSGLLLVATVGLWATLRLLGQAPRGGGVLIGLTVVAYGAVAWATSGLEQARYSFPFVFAVFAALAGRIEVPSGIALWGERLVRPAAVLATLGAVAIVALAVTPPGKAVGEKLMSTGLGKRWAQPALAGDPTGGYRQAQASIPAGSTILAIEVSHADRFDVRANRILAADQAAAAGPEPGWPSDNGPGVLGPYLAAVGVDYIAVSRTVNDPWTERSTEWQRRLGDASDRARSQLRTATEGVAPVAVGPDFNLYAVADLN